MPRAGFTEDGEWQRFVRNLQGSGKATVETHAAAESTSIDDSADTIGIVVTGPMNEAEAAAIFRANRHRRGFFWRYQLFLLVFLLATWMPLTLLAMPGSPLLTGQGITIVHLLRFVPLAVLLLLMVVGGVFVRKFIRQELHKAMIGFSTWVLDDDGIKIKRDGITASLNWARIKSKRIMPEGILLFGEEPGVVYLVRRSGFQSEQDWKEACGLVGSIGEAAYMAFSRELQRSPQSRRGCCWAAN